MPFVFVRRKQDKVGNEMMKVLTSALPEIVADALSVPDSQGALTKDDIEVKAEDVGPFDISTKDVEILVLAGDYPERKENLDERRMEIIRRINLLSDPETPTGVVSGFVWLVLVPNSFGEFVVLWD